MFNWLAQGLCGLVNMIDTAANNGVPVTKEDAEILRHEIKRLQQIADRLKCES